MPEAKQRSFKPENIDECIEFMGIELVPSAVQNPHLRRVIEKTAKGGFRFRYDDHSKSRHHQHSEYGDWGQTKYHEGYPYTDYGDYSDYSVYSESHRGP